MFVIYDKKLGNFLGNKQYAVPLNQAVLYKTLLDAEKVASDYLKNDGVKLISDARDKLAILKLIDI